MRLRGGDRLSRPREPVYPALYGGLSGSLNVFRRKKSSKYENKFGGRQEGNLLHLRLEGRPVFVEGRLPSPRATARPPPSSPQSPRRASSCRRSRSSSPETRTAGPSTLPTGRRADRRRVFPPAFACSSGRHEPAPRPANGIQPDSSPSRVMQTRPTSALSSSFNDIEPSAALGDVVGHEHVGVVRILHETRDELREVSA